jgi:2-polyprenyl-3-methyl-5-hydroxy-6-metoxy-1,4-benzoquinol methylase
MTSVIAGLMRARQLRAFFAPHVTRRRPCPVCESTDARHLLSGDRDFIGIRTAQCLSCGMIFSSPFYDSVVVDEFYRGAYRSVFKWQPDPKEFIARQTYLIDRARFFLALLEQERALPEANGSLLDVGSGEGTLLRTVRAARPDLRVWGVEPTVSYRDNAEAEIDVPIVASVSALDRGLAFDLVTCIHVLEHVRQPLELLRQIREHLTPGGSCYVDVPDAAAYSSVDDFHVAHCNHFTAHTLAMAAERAGMVVRRIQAHRPPSLPPSLALLAQRADTARRDVTADPQGKAVADRIVAMRVGRLLHMTRRARMLIARSIRPSRTRR